MTFIEAKQLASKHQNLVGKKKKGNIILSVIPVPINVQSKSKFLGDFQFSQNVDRSALPFINEEFTVFVIYEGGLETGFVPFEPLDRVIRQ